MTPPKLLDENALKEREQKIIIAAISLIKSVGIENLTMDKVVSQVPFSKGTVYKHFIGKEDLLLAISNHAIHVMSDLFYRTYEYKGCSRERMLLLNFSYLIYAILYPALFQTVLCSKAPSVVGKASEQRVNDYEKLETKLITAFHGIVEDGISDNSLVLPEHMDVSQLCFANWSTAYGAISLLSDEVEQCSGRNNMVVERELFNHSNLLLDGMGWTPLTKDKQYCVTLKGALKQLFPEELALMKENGRELNIS